MDDALTAPAKVYVVDGTPADVARSAADQAIYAAKQAMVRMSNFAGLSVLDALELEVVELDSELK